MTRSSWQCTQVTNHQLKVIITVMIHSYSQIFCFNYNYHACVASILHTCICISILKIFFRVKRGDLLQKERIDFVYILYYIIVVYCLILFIFLYSLSPLSIVCVTIIIIKLVIINKHSSSFLN